MYIELRENSTKYGSTTSENTVNIRKSYVLHIPKRVEHVTNK